MPIVNDMLPAVGVTSDADLASILKLVGLCIAAFLILGLILRAMFGKNSPLVRAASACVSIVMVYLTAIVLYLISAIRELVPPLPFLTVTTDAFYLWNPTEMAEGTLAPAMLRLFFLAVIMNFIDARLPKGKTLMSWYVVRMTGVIGAMALYMILGWAVEAFAPRVFGDLAQPILLGVWGFILLTGIVRWLLTLVLTAMNPIVGVLYGIFFLNPTGQQLSKAILTCLLAMALLVVLSGAGYGSFAFESFSFAAYGPACLAGVLVMYLFGKLL